MCVKNVWVLGLVFGLLCLVLFVPQSSNLVYASSGVIMLMSDVDGVSENVNNGDGSGLSPSSGVVILADGSVEGTDKIKQSCNVYTFTGDISGPILVQKSGITIDGAGYTLKGGDIDLRQGSGYASKCYDNVVVRNVRFDNCGIYASSDNNNFINNKFTGGTIRSIAGDRGNTIKHNVFTNCPMAIYVDYANYNGRGKHDVISENDFINSDIYVALANPVVDRNYWSDYRQRYPDAKVVAKGDTWDTPYARDKIPNGGNLFVDYNPLVKSRSGYVGPYDNIEPPKSTPENTPERTPENTPERTPEITKSPESFPTTQAITIVAVVSVIVISSGLLIYFKNTRLKKQVNKNSAV
jgi:hypothetical protein